MEETKFVCTRRGDRGGKQKKRDDSIDDLTLTIGDDLLKAKTTPGSTVMQIKRPKALMKSLHMCTKTMEQSIDMIVESAILQSPERRRSLLCKESEEKAQLNFVIDAVERFRNEPNLDVISLGASIGETDVVKGIAPIYTHKEDRTLVGVVMAE